MFIKTRYDHHSSFIPSYKIKVTAALVDLAVIGIVRNKASN